MSETLHDFGGLLNLPNLQAWIDANDIPGSGPITAIRQLQGGSQNNLFMIDRKGATVVLRRPPTHPRKNSNDIMIRESRVLKALAGSDVPHPTLYGACADTSVIGVCFYVMAPLDGFSPATRDPLPGQYGSDPSWRRAMGAEFVRCAAALSKVDYKAAGLGDFGKPDNWHSRQVSRWRSQLDGYSEMDGYEGSSLPHVDEVGEWLTRHTPAQGRMGIIHGDYQWPNVMFAHDRPEIIGLIDFELSALGDPILDLGWVLQSWREDGDPPGRPPTAWDWSAGSGFMTRDELVKLYGELAGRDMTDMPWYFVLACYKLGCILEGTYARSKAGQAPVETGERLHTVSVWLFRKAKQIISAN